MMWIRETFSVLQFPPSNIYKNVTLRFLAVDQLQNVQRGHEIYSIPLPIYTVAMVVKEWHASVVA